MTAPMIWVILPVAMICSLRSYDRGSTLKKDENGEPAPQRCDPTQTREEAGA
jgi:hypothetical protein